MAEDAARELPNLPLEDAVDALNAEGKTRESIRKSETALAISSTTARSTARSCWDVLA